MASLFTGLLFMHGHITDPELARRLAGVESEAAPPVKPAAVAACKAAR